MVQSRTILNIIRPPLNLFVIILQLINIPDSSHPLHHFNWSVKSSLVLKRLIIFLSTSSNTCPSLSRHEIDRQKNAKRAPKLHQTYPRRKLITHVFSLGNQVVYVLMIEANSMCIGIYIQKLIRRREKKGTSNFHEVLCFSGDENLNHVLSTHRIAFLCFCL